MAGAGGQEVGRVSIKVVPDLAEFRAKLDATLAFYEGRELHINVVADNLKEFRASVEHAADGITAEVAAEAKTAGVREKIKAAVSGVTADVDVDVDDKGSLDRFQRRALARLNAAFSKIEVKLDLTDDGEYRRRMYEAAESVLRKSAEMGVPKLVEDAALFRQDIEAAVKKAEALNASMQDPFDLEKTIAARKKFETKVDRIRADAERAGSAQRVRDRKAREAEGAEILAARKAFEAKVANIRAEAERLGSAHSLAARREAIKAEAELVKAGVAMEVDRFSRRIDSKLDLDIEFRNFNAQLAKAQEAGEELGVAMQRGFEKVGGTGLAANAGLKLRNAFKNLFKVGELEKGETALGKIGDRLKSIPKSLFNSIKNFRAFGLGLGTILAIAALLPPAISIIAGSLLTLPAVIAGILVPIAAIALGMDGIKKAAEVLKEPFEGLKKIMSDTFEKGLAQPFEDLKKIFPVLNESMPNVAKGLSAIAQGMVDAVTSVPGLGKIRNIIDNIGTGLTNSAPGFQSFTGGFTKLISEVTNKFPGVGDSLSRIGDQFSGWIDKITMPDANGVSQLDTALRSLRDALAPLGGAVGDLFRKGFEKLLDPKFANSMKTFMQDMRALANTSFDGLSGAFAEMARSIRYIKDTWNSLPKGLRDFLGASEFDPGDPTKLPTRRVGMVPVEDTKPKEDQSTTQLEMLTKLTPLAELLKSQVEALALSIKVMFAGLPPAATLAWQRITLGISTFVTAIPTLLSVVPMFFSTAFGTVGTVTGNAFTVAVATVRVKAGEITSEISTWPGRFAAALGDLSTTLAAAGVQLVTGLLTSILPKFVEVETEVRSWPGKIIAAIGDMGSTLLDAGVALMNGLKSGIERGLEAVLDFARGIAAKIKAVKGPIPKDRTTLVPAGEALMEGLGNGMDSGFQDVLARTKAMAKAIFEAMKEVFGNASGANFNFNLGGAESSMSSIASSAQGFSENMGSALNPGKAAKLSDATKADIAGMKQESAGLDVQIAKMREQKFYTDKAGKAALDAQIAELNARKANTTATIKQMEYDGKYGENANAMGDEMMSTLKKSGQGMVGLGQSVLSTHAQDLGISGTGALSTIAQSGLDWGSQFVFNVSNMDDALAAQKRETDKQSLQY